MPPSQEFKDFFVGVATAKAEEDVSNGSDPGFLSLAEWGGLWVISCKEYPECSYGNEEADIQYAADIWMKVPGASADLDAVCKWTDLAEALENNWD